MGQHLLPGRMSLPEVMGDPCASELRDHALALLRATASSYRVLQLTTLRPRPSDAEAWVSSERLKPGQNGEGGIRTLERG